MSGSLFGPTSPKGGGAGVGGGNPLTVQDEGVLVDANTTLIDFIGAGVTASSAGPGQVDVTIPGLAEGLWAGFEPLANFSGSPLTATVVFPSPHPSGSAYSVALEEVVSAGSGLSLVMSVENKTANGFDIVLNTAGPVPNLIGIDWQVQGSTSSIPGFWAGAVPAVSFGGVPLTASVVFGSPHPSGVNYAIAVENLFSPGTSLALDISIENKTANGFDIVLNTAGPVPGFIQAEWQVQPYDTTPGPASVLSLPGIQNIVIVDKGSNATEDGSQQFPYHTIQGALAVASAGDLVLVYPGVYTEQITPVDGVVVRGVDQVQCILENPGNTPADAPIATVGTGVNMLIENMTVRTTVGDVLHQLGVDQETGFKDSLLFGQIDLASNGAVLRTERNVIWNGQLLVSGGDGDTEAIMLDTNLTAAGVFPEAIYLDAPSPTVTAKRCEIYGRRTSDIGNEFAIYWNDDNDNVQLAWSVLMNGGVTVASPFGRAAGQTPTYKSHHDALNVDPESGGIWTNAVPVGQRFDTLSNVARY